MTDKKQKDGWDRLEYKGVRTTRAEQALFGADYAPFVRELGKALGSTQEAVELAQQRRDESFEADKISAGLTEPPELNESGETKETEWRSQVLERTIYALRQIETAYLSLAQDAILHEASFRTRKPVGYVTASLGSSGATSGTTWTVNT